MRALLRLDVLCAVVLLALGTPGLVAQDTDTLPQAEPVAEAQPLAEAEPVAQAESVEPKGPATATALSVTMQLNVGNTELRGTLLSTPQFTMKTSFGELVIPMSQVAGIKLASQANSSTTVIMHNGDSVTGAWDLDRLELRTEWGEATVEGAAINSLLFTPNMAWVSERGLSGSRWSLMVKPESAETPAGAEGLKVGDVIITLQESELRAGTEVVGRLNQDDVLVIEGALEGHYYVNNGKAAGWIAKENVAPYKEPEPGTAQPRSNTTPSRGTYIRRR
jgi:hypothetical protein